LPPLVQRRRPTSDFVIAVCHTSLLPAQHLRSGVTSPPVITATTGTALASRGFVVATGAAPVTFLVVVNLTAFGVHVALLPSIPSSHRLIVWCGMDAWLDLARPFLSSPFVIAPAQRRQSEVWWSSRPPFVTVATGAAPSHGFCHRRTSLQSLAQRRRSEASSSRPPFVIAATGAAQAIQGFVNGRHRRCRRSTGVLGFRRDWRSAGNLACGRQSDGVNFALLPNIPSSHLLIVWCGMVDCLVRHGRMARLGSPATLGFYHRHSSLHRRSLGDRRVIAAAVRHRRHRRGAFCCHR
jgi:hypothetical protein